MVTASLAAIALQVSEELLQDIIRPLRLYEGGTRFRRDLNRLGELLIPVFVDLPDHFLVGKCHSRQVFNLLRVAKLCEARLDGRHV